MMVMMMEKKKKLAAASSSNIPSGALVLSFLVLSLSCSAVSSQTTDSCNTKLALGSSIPFDTSSLKCFNAWTSQGFILRYAQTAQSLWSYVLSAPDNGGYIAIGFSPNGGMIGSSALAGWTSSSSGGGTVKQYLLNGYSSSQCAPDTGSLQLVKNSTAIVSRSSRLYLAFQLNTANPLTRLVYAVGPAPSSGSAYLPTHQSKATGSINSSSSGGGGGGEGDGDDDGEGEHNRGGDSGERTKEEGDGDGSSKVSSSSSSSGFLGISKKKGHGLLAMVGWGILMPIGIMMARYLKLRDPFWFYSHVGVQTVGFVVGVLGVLAGLKLEDSEGEGVDVDAHKTIGIAILVFGCLQVLAVLARPSKEAKARKYWNWYHHYVGRAAIVLAIADVFYGYALAKESKAWSYAYGTFLGIWAVACLVLEEWWKKKSAAALLPCRF